MMDDLANRPAAGTIRRFHLPGRESGDSGTQPCRQFGDLVDSGAALVRRQCHLQRVGSDGIAKVGQASTSLATSVRSGTYGSAPDAAGGGLAQIDLAAVDRNGGGFVVLAMRNVHAHAGTQAALVEELQELAGLSRTRRGFPRCARRAIRARMMAPRARRRARPPRNGQPMRAGAVGAEAASAEAPRPRARGRARGARRRRAARVQCRPIMSVSNFSAS